MLRNAAPTPLRPAATAGPRTVVATLRLVCDTLVSLTDRGVLFAKNSDREPNEAQVIRWFPAADHPPGGDVSCTWIAIPQVEHTHAVVVSQPWWMWGAEMGANSHGLVIGNEAVYTTEPYGGRALLGMDLVRLALERANTADDALGVIVDLLERHGQGGPCSHVRPGFTYHNSFLIADPQGAVVLETAGRHWAVDRVSGRGRSISNGLTIAGFAERFAEASRGRDVACDVRRARTQAAAERADSTGDLFAALRDHGDGVGIRWSPRNGSLAGPCVHAGGRVTAAQTTASWVADLRHGGLHWVTATAAPCTSVFHPVRVDEAVDLGASPTDRFDPHSRWWRHEVLHRMMLRDHPAATARIAEAREAVEAAWISEPPKSVDAFAQSADLEQRWLNDLVGADLVDRRPAWLRRHWQGYDDAAGFRSVWSERTDLSALTTQNWHGQLDAG